MERLRDLDEAELLARIVPRYASTRGVVRDPAPVGPGDDAAVVAAPSGSVVATTDTMVRGRDWRDEWSSAHDVGRKAVAQNLADVAAMGAVPTALLVALMADPETPVDWCLGLADGIAQAAAEAGAEVVGGDVSSAGAGQVVVAVTALGDLRGRRPVLRSGARPGDVVAVCGSLGLSGGGLALLEAGEGLEEPRWGPDTPASRAVTGLVAYHRAPQPPWGAGAVASAAHAHALVDVSDGLVTDVGRVATASGVRVDLFGRVLRERFAAGPLTLALGEEEAMRQVLSGGEEHALVGCFPPDVVVTSLPGPAWVVVGQVHEAGGQGALVTVDDEAVDARGWDHFAGRPARH
jgi:thiamine-monophosphate kinase